MSEQPALLALRCLQCNTPVPAQPDEVAWVCATCQTGLLLDETNGLTKFAFHFADGIKGTGRPVWVAQGKVALDRTSRNLLGKDGDAERFWDAPRQFIIPAWSCGVDELVDLAIGWLQTPIGLKAGPAASFLPVTLRPEDARPVAEYVIVGIEALRKDQLRKVEFTLDLGEPELWVLP